mmetsp:Transcript_18246/g.23512  ORF Transcript_18246/g.23512 Transcript_18246/m.23512 type:complete len:297 (+) Transcript_18246:64-954(+)
MTGSKEKNPQPVSLYLTQEAAGGLSAGVVGTVIGYPLDLIKTRMQTGSKSGGILATGTNIVRNEGMLAMYKGVGPPLLSLSILNTLNFTAYSFFHSYFQAERGWDYRNFLAGGVIGPFASTVSTIENLVKTQMQVDNVTRKQFRNSLDCVKQITVQHGNKALYTGHAINTIRESAFISTYFFMYEGLRKHMIDFAGLMGSNSAAWPIPVAGGCAGAIAWTVSFPLDCIRAGVQGSDLSNKKGSFRVIQHLVSTKGVMGLYSGVAPSIIRAFLVSGSRFSAYEFALWMLRGGREGGL